MMMTLVFPGFQSLIGYAEVKPTKPTYSSFYSVYGGRVENRIVSKVFKDWIFLNEN